MPGALSVPGMLHILDNAASEVDLVHLDHFENWYVDLKNVAQFLCSKDYRRRFVVTCLRKSLLAGDLAEKICEKSPPQLHEKRWGHIINFLLAAHQQVHYCRVAWDTRSYQGENPKASKAFSVEQLQRTLSSPWFFAYYEMMLKLHGAIDEVRKFAERCPCHPPRERDKQMHPPSATHKPCPMNTLRAPEMAAGAVTDLLQKLRSEGVSELLAATRVSLPAEDWTRIAQDFNQGMSAFSGIIGVKCRFWGQLPWQACSMLHWNEEIAKKGCKECLELWAAASPPGKAALPLIIRNLLSEPHTLEQLQRWESGVVSRAELPREVLASLAPLTFIPIAERVIEAQHSIMKKRLGYARAGPVACSMALRGGSFLEQVLRKEPGQFEVLVQCFEEARHLRSFAMRRGRRAQAP